MKQWIHVIGGDPCTGGEGVALIDQVSRGICNAHDRRVDLKDVPSEGVFAPIHADGVTYTLWTNGWSVGYKCQHDDGRVEYIYLNASGGSDDGVPTVFVYQGPTGDPSVDEPATHHEILQED